MKRIQKKSVILTSLIFTIILLLNLIPFSAKAEEQRGKPQALSWLKEMGEESGEWKMQDFRISPVMQWQYCVKKKMKQTVRF